LGFQPSTFTFQLHRHGSAQAEAALIASQYTTTRVAELPGVITSLWMAALDAPEINPEPLESDLAVAGVYPTEQEAAEHGLVVLASGYSYWLASGSDGIRLMIEPAAVDVTRAHLAAYDRESIGWPPPPITDPWLPAKVDFFTPLLWAAAVLVIFNLTARFPTWIDRGALRADAVFTGGEWWRPVTALFLHADAAHVTSNAVSGLLVFSAVLSTLGRARGWLLLSFSAVAGNLAVAAASYPEPYSSIGASTAIFAGVGLLSGRSVRIAWRSTHPHRWRAMFAPFAAGATVLALYGAGGQRVDVGAHLAGFVAGFVLGFLAGVRRAKTDGS
jgi:rhomboid protease GluP